MNGRALESINACSILTPRGPDFLSCGVHNDDLGVSSLVETGCILIESSRGDVSMVSLKDSTEADIAIGLDSLIVVEEAIELDVSRSIVSVVLVVVELDKVGGIVGSAEKVVWERSKSKMDHHGAVCGLESSLNICNVLRELNSVTEHESPWLTVVGNVRGFGVVSGVTDIHDLLSN